MPPMTPTGPPIGTDPGATHPRAPSRWTVWAGPPHPTRTRALADRILEEVDAHGPDAVLVVVAAGLRRERVVRALLDVRPGGLFLPSIVPLDGLTRTLAGALEGPPRILDPAARRVLLGELVTRLAARGTLRDLAPGRELPGVVQRLDHFLQALGRQKVDTPDLLDALVDRYRGGTRLRLDDEVRALLAAYRVHVPVEPASPAAGPEATPPTWTTPIEVQRTLARDPERIRGHLPGVRLVVVDGFLELTPRQADLVETLVEAAGEGLLIREALRREPDPDLEGGRDAPRSRPLDRAPVRWHPAPDDPVTSLALALAGDDLDALPATRPELDPDRITLSPAPTPRAEVVRLARHLADHRDAGDLDRVAVAFAGLERYLPLVREVFVRQGIPLEARMGIPLASAPPVATALALLDTVAARTPRGELVGLLRSPYLALPGLPEGILPHADRWARAAGIVGGDPDPGTSWLEPLDRLARELDAEHDPDRMRRRIDPRDVEEVRALRDAMAVTFDLLHPLLEMVDRPVDAETCVTTLGDVLDRVGVWRKAEESLADPALRGAGRRDLEARRVLERLLEDLTATLADLEDPPRLTLGGWILRLRALVAEETLAPMEEVPGGVPVVALTDLRHLAADVVFVGGLTEGHFPRRRTRDLLYPETHDPDRDFLAHPDPAHEDATALLGAIVERRRVHLSYPHRIAEEDQLPAALVDRLAAVATIAPMASPAGPPPRADRLVEALAHTRGTPDRVGSVLAAALDDPALVTAPTRILPALRVEVTRTTEAASAFTGFLTGSRVATRLAARAPGGAHVYSATELERYAGCGFRTLVERVLGLGDLDEVEEEVSPLTRGRLLHTILHRFHEDERQGRVDVLGDEAPATLARIAADVLAELPSGTLLADAARRALVGGLDPADGGRPGTLAAYLDAERTRRTEGIVPLALEWPFGLGPDAAPPVRLPSSRGTVRVRGMVDRVDAHGDVRIVVDYKTGTVPSAREITDGQRFQLPIYLAAFRGAHPDQAERRWLAAYYAVPPRGEDPIRKLTRHPLSPREVDRDLDELASRIGELTHAMGSGSFPLTLLRGSKAPCGLERHGAGGRGCPFRRVCRIDGTRLTVRTAALATSGVPVYGLDPGHDRPGGEGGPPPTAEQSG